MSSDVATASISILQAQRVYGYAITLDCLLADMIYLAVALLVHDIACIVGEGCADIV